MDVISACRLPVGSCLWQSSTGAWTLTIVGKATFALCPGESPLADDQDEPTKVDLYWNDDERCSLRAPSDLVPFKRGAEVLVVGSAFAPRGEPVQSLVARLAVAGIDKTIEVFCDRAVGADGVVRYGAPFTSMPLVWERAAGGLGSANPVGVSPATEGHLRRLPNLEAPGAPAGERATTPVGFGPIAPSWADRQGRVHRGLAGWDYRRWQSRPVATDLDPGFWNAAPPDQQIERLRQNERLVLENLHPDLERVVTVLAPVRVGAHVEWEGGASREVEMFCDTLFIDTDRGVCSSTWRGRIGIDLKRLPKRVVLSESAPLADPRAPRGSDGPPPALSGAVSTALEPAPNPRSVRGRTTQTTQTMLIEAPTASALPFSKPVPSALPFRAAIEAPAPAQPQARGFVSAAPAAEPFDDADTEDGGSEPKSSTGTLRLALSAFARPDANSDALPSGWGQPRRDDPEPSREIVAPASAAELSRAAAPSMAQQQDAGIAALSPAVTTPEPPPMIGPLAALLSDPPPPPAPEVEVPNALDNSAASPEVTRGDPPLPLEPYPLERCAAIAASIARSKSAKDRILAEHELEPDVWDALDKHWSEVVRAELRRGRVATLKAYDSAYVAQLEKERGPLGPNEYAALAVAEERGSEDEALAALDLPRGAVLRFQRVWLDKTFADPELGKTSRAAVEAARAR